MVDSEQNRVPHRLALPLMRVFGAALLLLGLFVMWISIPDLFRRAEALDVLIGEARLIGWQERSESVGRVRYPSMCAKFEFKGTPYKFERCMLSLHDFTLLKLHMQNGNFTRVWSHERECRERGEAGSACHASRLEINGLLVGDLADLSGRPWRVSIAPLFLVALGAASLLFPKPAHLGGWASNRVMKFYGVVIIGLIAVLGFAYLWTAVEPVIGDRWEALNTSRPTIRLGALAASDGAPRVTLHIHKRSGGRSEWVLYRFPGFDGRHGEINLYAAHHFADLFEAFADTPSLQKISFTHENQRVEIDTPLARYTALHFVPWTRAAYRDCWYFYGPSDTGGIRGWLCAALRERIEPAELASILDSVQLVQPQSPAIVMPSTRSVGASTP
jgi:hypothetical protein